MAVFNQLQKLFTQIYKGANGEAHVLEAISKLLRSKNGEDNYFLIPKATIKDLCGSKEIDLLLLHPTLGIYIIEVKNWTSFDNFNNETNNPMFQANQYQDILMSLLNIEFNGKVPINVEYRVIFPSISEEQYNVFAKENKFISQYENNIFFKEHLVSKDIFSKFFNSSISSLPNKKDFMKIASLVMPIDSIKSGSEKILPIITNDEIIFFDHKQLSIMNGYTGGLRVIRGVAGTGKTAILTNFIESRIRQDDSEHFLVLCFNKKLQVSLKQHFNNELLPNISLYSMSALLEVIGFEHNKIGVLESDNISDRYLKYETIEALREFKSKFEAYIAKHPIDYFVCDETQDMPAGFIRIICDAIEDNVLFIDEAQRIYDFSMKDIGSVFRHPHFDVVSLKGRVKNLKNVYRTPSNIAKAAFQILSFDNGLNDYYKKSFYLKDGFLQDVNFVLEEGNLKVYDFNKFEALRELINTIPDNEDTIILAYTKKSLEAIETIIKDMGRENIKAMTMQSVKGLEASNIIIHGFEWFLKNGTDDINLFRKIYVLMTRATQNLYISLDFSSQPANEKSKLVYDALLSFKLDLESQTLKTIDKNNLSNDKGLNLGLKISKPKHNMKKIKEYGEVVVVASELFKLFSDLVF